MSWWWIILCCITAYLGFAVAAVAVQLLAWSFT